MGIWSPAFTDLDTDFFLSPPGRTLHLPSCLSAGGILWPRLRLSGSASPRTAELHCVSLGTASVHRVADTVGTRSTVALEVTRTPLRNRQGESGVEPWRGRPTMATLLRVLELVALRRWFATCDDDGRRTNTGRARGEVWGGDENDRMGLARA